MNNDAINRILNFTDKNDSSLEEVSRQDFIDSLSKEYHISSHEQEMLLKCELKSELRECAIKLLEGLPYETQATMNQISGKITDYGYPDNKRFTDKE